MFQGRTLRNSLVLVSLFAFASLSYAQVRSATITGTVTDPSGAAVPEATVVVTNQATKVSTTTKSTSAGQFTVPYLAPGDYTVEVNASGFTQYAEHDITLAVNQTRGLDVHLAVGAASQQIEVTAPAAQLQTESSSMQTAVDSHTIESIPNITMDPLLYARLQANVSPTVASADTTSINSFGIGVNGRRQYSAFAVNGGIAFWNDIELDGLPIMGGGYNEAAIVPNPSGLAEVRVMSNNNSAQYGHGEGVVAMTIKSGTNQFHGQGSYQLRNEAFNANTFANNQVGVRRPPFKEDELGVDVGGPIIKDKLFFFTSYGYLRHNTGIVNLLTVPTALQRTGDFSQSLIPGLNGAPVPVQIYNPWNVTQLGPNLFQRAPYPNAIIPASASNPYALKMLSNYPQPNRTPVDAFGDQNYLATGTQTIRRHSVDARIDYTRGKNSFYGSGGLYYGIITTPPSFGAGSVKPLNDAPSVTRDRNPYGQIGDTITLNPTTVLDLRYGYFRINTQAFGGNKTGWSQADYNAYGIPQNVQSLFVTYGAAPIITPGVTGSGSNGVWSALSGGTFANKHERQQGHVVEGSITKVAGSWTMTEGADFRVILSNYNDFEEATAQLPAVYYNQGGNYTQQYIDASGNTVPQDALPQQLGYNNAFLFTGADTWFVRPGADVQPALAQKYFALFTQNDWHVNSKLTINLGLRWDLQPGPTERYNRMSSYDFNAANPFYGQGVIAFPGTRGYSRNMWNTEWTDFQPRLGAAYQLTSRTVLRGGYGITYLPTNTGYFSGPTDYGSVTFSTGINVQPYGANPNGVPVAHFWDPAQLLIAPGASYTNPQVYGQGGNQRLFTRDMQNGRVYQANFEIQHQFGQNWIASAGYNGAFGRHLMNVAQTFEDLQSLPASTLSGWRNQYIASNGTLNPATQMIRNPYYPTNFAGALGAQTIQQQIPLMPYPILYGGVLTHSNGFSSYNALVLQLSRAWSSGIEFNANYVWSKALDYTNSDDADNQGFNAGAQQVSTTPDLLNINNNRKYSFSDIPNRFTTTLTYALPFGAGRKFTVSNHFLQAIAGGWSLGGVVVAQGGFPASITGASNGSILNRPNRIRGVPVEAPASLQHWYNGKTSVTLPCGMIVTPPANTFLKYNACAFGGQTVTTPNGGVVPDVYWIGSEQPTDGDIRGPGRFNIDLTLRKNIKLTERFNLEIAANATNLLNSTELNSQYTGSLGNTSVVTNPKLGLIPGEGTNNAYGTITNATYDPRQITFDAVIRF
jgi:hypothetical protein